MTVAKCDSRTPINGSVSTSRRQLLCLPWYATPLSCSTSFILLVAHTLQEIAFYITARSQKLMYTGFKFKTRESYRLGSREEEDPL